MESIDQTTSLLTDKLDGWLQSAIQYFPNIIAALLVMLVFIILAKVSKRGSVHFFRRFIELQALHNLFAKCIYLIVLFTGAFIALGILKLDKTVTSLLAGAGIVGLALGFAFQEIASNFIAGILILFEQPYREGDVVEIDRHLGTVTRIDLRVTVIQTFNGLEVLLPNKMMYTSPLINYTLTPYRRLDFVIGVSYGDDLEKVKKVASEALSTVSVKAHLEPQVYFQEFGSSSINLMAQVWIEFPGKNDYWIAHEETIMKLKKAFDENNITIPFPIRTLDFGIKGGRTLDQVLAQQK